MRFAVLILLAVPATVAVRCWVGGAFGDESNGAFVDTNCGTMSDMCYKQDIVLIGVRTISKSCGATICNDVGYDAQTGITCCKGDLCNSAPSASPLVTSLMAAMAAWMWC